MTRLVSGVAVVTAQRADGMPCGLLVSSICSYSVRPPSILVAVDQASRTYATLTRCAEFGAHLLSSDHIDMANIFAGRSDDKFADLPWSWDANVPRLHRIPVYLHCVITNLFHHADHAIVIGEVRNGHIDSGEPLVYFRRRLDWRLRA